MVFSRKKQPLWFVGAKGFGKQDATRHKALSSGGPKKHGAGSFLHQPLCSTRLGMWVVNPMVNSAPVEDLWRVYRGFVVDLWRIYGGFMEDYYLGMIEIPVFWMILISGPLLTLLWLVYGTMGLRLADSMNMKNVPAEPDEGSPRLTENLRFCHGCNTSLIQIHWEGFPSFFHHFNHWFQKVSHFSHDVPYVQSIPSLEKDLNLPPPPTNTYKGLIILYYGLFSSWKLGSFYPEKHRLWASNGNSNLCVYVPLSMEYISTRKLLLFHDCHPKHTSRVLKNVTPGYIFPWQDLSAIRWGPRIRQLGWFITLLTKVFGVIHVQLNHGV